VSTRKTSGIGYTVKCSDEEWAAWVRLMERPPQVKPRLRELFMRGSIFDRPIDPFAEDEPNDTQPSRKPSR